MGYLMATNMWTHQVLLLTVRMQVSPEDQTEASSIHREQSYLTLFDASDEGAHSARIQRSLEDQAEAPSIWAIPQG